MDFEEGAKGCRGKLFAVAFRMLSSASDAEDVTQDALVIAHGNPLTSSGNFSPSWTMGVLKNLCRKRIRDRAKEPVTVPTQWCEETLAECCPHCLAAETTAMNQALNHMRQTHCDEYALICEQYTTRARPKGPSDSGAIRAARCRARQILRRLTDHYLGEMGHGR